MALKITLKPGEFLYVGSARIAVEMASTHDVFIEGDAPILRSRDVIAKEDATTPLGKLRYALQQAYLHCSDDADVAEAASHIDDVADDALRAELETCVALFLSGQRFKGLRALIGLERANPESDPAPFSI